LIPWYVCVYVCVCMYISLSLSLSLYTLSEALAILLKALTPLAAATSLRWMLLAVQPNGADGLLPVYIYVYTYIYIHTHIHIYIYVHTYVYIYIYRAALDALGCGRDAPGRRRE